MEGLGAQGMALPLDGVWTEEPAGGPVIDRGPHGAWDHVAVDNPFVYVEDGTFYCFYEAENAGGQEQVGLAVSTDLLKWTKHKSNPVLRAGPPGAWDHRAAKLPVVAKHGETYVMLYTGKDGRGAAIGLATSKDLLYWDKAASNPVIPGRPGEWDPLLTTCPAIVQRRGVYHAIYRGMTGFYANQRLGLLTSSDLLHWTRRGAPLAGLDGIYSFAVCDRSVDGTYFALAQQRPRKHAYLSSDLIHWRRGPTLAFSAGHIDTPSQPILIDGTYWILYEKGDRIYRARLGPKPEPVPLVQAEVPFRDDFQDAQRSASHWEPLVGVWQIVDGRYAQLSVGHEWSRALAHTRSMKSCVLQAEVRVAGGKGWVGLCFRGTDGLFAFAVVHDGRNIARLFKSKTERWGRTNWMADVPCEPHRDRPYSLRMDVSPEGVRCWIDGVKVIERSDPNPQRSGRAGLFTAAASARFGSVAVSSDDEAKVLKE